MHFFSFSRYMYLNLSIMLVRWSQAGADPGGGSWGSGPPPPPFGGPLNFIKREKMLRTCARKHRILVLNSYVDPPFLKSCIRPCQGCLKDPEIFHKSEDDKCLDISNVCNHVMQHKPHCQVVLSGLVIGRPQVM